MKKEDQSVDDFEFFVSALWLFYLTLLLLIIEYLSNIIMSLPVFMMGELSLWGLYSYKSKQTGKSYKDSKYWFMICLALMYAVMIIAYTARMMVSISD